MTYVYSLILFILILMYEYLSGLISQVDSSLAANY